jgi:hypothetical protein
MSALVQLTNTVSMSALVQLTNTVSMSALVQLTNTVSKYYIGASCETANVLLMCC